MGKGVVFGELCYAGKSQLDLEPLIDRAGEDAVSRAVYSTRLYFCISTAKDIVAGIQKVRIVVLLCRFRRAVGRSVGHLTLSRTSWHHRASWIVLVCGQIYRM